MKHIKTGDEQFIMDGFPIEQKLIDFWKWSVSDLISNSTRGVLAEFIVATAMQIDPFKVRDEWGAYDLLTKEGIKIEVKSAAYIQSWKQRTPSNICFSIKAAHCWDAETNIQSQEKTRHADVYVFCLLAHLDKETIDPLNLDQWVFYVLSTKELDNYQRSKHSITLPSLKKLTPPLVYSEIQESVLSKFKYGQPSNLF
jgi:hypothetical protein